MTLFAVRLMLSVSSESTRITVTRSVSGCVKPTSTPTTSGLSRRLRLCDLSVVPLSLSVMPNRSLRFRPSVRRRACVSQILLADTGLPENAGHTLRIGESVDTGSQYHEHSRKGGTAVRGTVPALGHSPGARREILPTFSSSPPSRSRTKWPNSSSRGGRLILLLYSNDINIRQINIECHVWSWMDTEWRQISDRQLVDSRHTTQQLKHSEPV